MKLLMALACFVSAAVAAPSIYVAGDSTANNANHRGWADPIADYFDATKVQVVNRARGGRSSRTFYTEGLWDRLRADLKPGDYVLIQFGHNDGGAPDRPPFRGSLPGLGDETQEVTVPSGATETVHTFGWYMRKYIADTKAAGATPIVLSPTVRNIWTDGKVERGLGSFRQWSQEIARAQGLAFLDVTSPIADRYEVMGEAKVKAFFPEDHTHTSAEGADLNASLVVACLKGSKETAPVTDWLSEKGRALAPYPILLPDRSSLHLPVPANPALPTLFLIGDSTVRNGHGDGGNGQWGWGEPLVDYFDATKLNVVNRAVGGLSSRTYVNQGDWDHVLAMLKPGDFVVMQFGHNDNGPLDDPARARGTLKGSGDETRTIYNPLTKQQETVHSYGWYIRKFITEARSKGATPIVCSLIPRKIWKDGKIVRASDSYGKWAADAAAAEHASFVDLNEIIARRYDELGQEKVEPLFADEHTHTSRAGAELNAECVVAGLKGIPGNPLAAYLSEKGKAVTR
jgi:lysophospholipase L1-like esterase